MARRTRESGQALLLFTLLVLSVGLLVFVYGALSEVSRAIKADTVTKSALERARDALIARAVSDSNRPGSLPCPDTNDDGSAELLSGTDCPSYIGRLPWRTLGVGDLRDESGERLWYALSPNFRDHTTVAINSNSIGNRSVYSGVACGSANVNACTQANSNFPQPGGGVTQTAAAVVFAPGVALPGQVRDSSSATCTTTGTSISARLCTSNYLETDPDASHPGAIAPWNNASATGPYMNAQPTLQFNDKLLVLRNTDFMPLVERRVAGDLLDALREYRTQSKLAGCDCLPWPDRTGDGTSDADNNRGHLPLNALPHNWSRPISAITKANPGVITTTTPHGWTSGQQVYLSGIGGMLELNARTVSVTVVDTTHFSTGVDTRTYGTYSSGGTVYPTTLILKIATPTFIPSLPAYFQPNNWASVIYYTVGKSSLELNGIGCAAQCTVNSTLSVNGSSGYSAVLITPGPIAPGQTRTVWAHYIDDAENRDANPQSAGGGAAADPAYNDAYRTPPQACPAGQCPTLLGTPPVQRCVASTASCPPERDIAFSRSSVLDPIPRSARTVHAAGA